MSNIQTEAKKPSYYISDYKLVHRIKEYISEAEKPDEINKDNMIEDLRLKYKEYGRRQKSAFRALVLRAYKMVLENQKNNQNEEKPSQENGDSESDAEPNDDGTQDNQVNDDGEGDDNEENDEEDDEDNGNADENDDDDEEEGGDEDNEDEAVDMDVYDSMEITDTDNYDEPVHAAPYLECIRNMTNSSRQKTVADDELINISSDEESAPQEAPLMKKHVYLVPRDSKLVNFTHKYTMPNLPQVKITAIGKGTKRRAEKDDITSTSKKFKEDINNLIPKVTFKMFGGFSKILKTVSSLVMHIKESGIYQTLGVNPPRGILLHGPPGCGKTLLAQAIAGQLEVPLIRVAGPELVGGISGESESRIRDLFESALADAPCILFIDEIDAICPPRDTARREMERRIVAQLLTCIDSLSESRLGEKVVIIGATNRADALDPALRRAGRFDRELCLGIPDRAARKEILEVITKNVKLKPDLDLDFFAAATPGFVGADIKSLLSEAAIAAVNRCLENQNKENESSSTTTDDPKREEMVNGIDHSNELESNSLENMETEDKPSKQSKKSDELNCYLSMLNSSGPQLSLEQLEDLFIEKEDIMKALKTVQPSAKREGFATVPDVTWENIGSLRDIRSELERSIMMPVKYPKEFSLLGITAPSGILLCGPPGCGKTLLAKAVANEANINFISVKGPELLNMYVGESERAVRQCFQRARNSQPCVIFFDEIDALCPKRAASFEGHNTSSRVVNQVLTEMDGVEGREGVFLMAATNRPDMVDPAVLRPGRLDKILYVGLPSPSDRADILKALTKNGTTPPMKDVDLNTVGSDPLLEGYTGADLAALVKEASVLALTEYIKHKDANNLFVTSEMINQAARKIRPSVSPRERIHYEKLRDLYGPEKKSEQVS